MVFNGIDKQTVELEIVNYEFPQIEDGSWDSNWLNVRLDVKSNFGNWQVIQPLLTTWEVQWLIDWFNTLAISIRPERMFSTFTEPTLTFELLSDFDADKKNLRILIGSEYYVDLIADKDELQGLSSELKKELDKYPARKPLQKDVEHNRPVTTRKNELWDPFEPVPGPDTVPKGYKIFPKN